MLSVIVPVYNDEAYLEQTLQAIEHQTYKDYELILVDDGSTDETGKILQKWVSKDNRIKLLRQKNGGVSNAREYGYRNSSGDYLLFLDHDDLFHPQLFELLMKHKNEAELVYAGSIEKKNSKILEWDWSEPNEKGQLLDGMSAVHHLIFKDQGYEQMRGFFWGMLIPRTFFEKIENIIEEARNRIPIVYFEDVFLTHQFFYKANSVLFLNEKLILHRVSTASLGRALKPTPFGYDVIEANHLKILFFKEHKLDMCFQRALLGYYLSLLKAWWQIKSYEKDRELANEKEKVIYEYFDEFFEQLKKTDVSNRKQKAIIASIKLFRINPYIWKLLIGNPWFYIKYRLDTVGE